MRTAAPGLLPVLAVSLMLPACERADTSPTEPAPPVPPAPRGVSFSADAVSDPSVGLRGVASGADLEVEVYAAGVEDLYGLAFDLLYPANLLRYEATSGGVLPSLEAREAEAGRLIMGSTHLGEVTGLTGGGTVAVIRFTAIGNGSGGIDFSDQEAFDSYGEVLTLNWQGGTVKVDL